MNQRAFRSHFRRRTGEAHMDLSDAYITLLATIRKRSRDSKTVVAFFGLKGLLLTGVAIWFAFRACSPSLILDEQDPFWSIEMLVRHENLSVAAFFGAQALLCLTICLSTWSQRNSDVLTLKLIDKA